MMNLDVYQSLIFGGTTDRDWGSDYFHAAAATPTPSFGGDDGLDEDDILYAELSRQVLLLTADDDEDVEEEEARRRRRFDEVNGYGNFVVNMKRPASANSNEGYGCWSNFGSSPEFTHHPYFNLWESGKDQYGGNFPAGGGWQQGGPSWGSPVNSGTGVFIPHVVTSKRRHRRGKKNGKKRAGSGNKQGGESK